MYLKSLELQGFKSFPDKTVLNFNKGITAVVGPNGSGKSNIGDAMRWVMGEQSSKALRGDKMSGVIFHGTQTRPKSPFAQVTITIDNEDRALDFDSDLVSVSRKLYQNGDSEYMVNGNGVRLKDIYELFLDTGLGKDGYSIIGQGKIADIVNGKSNDRREIFEEAAGISRFRYKKEEAEKKLVSAEDNILRLNDILSEIVGRIEPLKKQCEKAKQFRLLDDEKRNLEVSLWVYRLDEYVDKLDEYAERLSVLKKQYSDLSDELKDDEDEINEYFRKSAEKSDEVDKLKNEIHLTELENSKSESEIAVLENDISHLEDNILQTKDQIEKSRSSKCYLEDELKKRREELDFILEKKEKTQQLIDEKENHLANLTEKAEKSDRLFSDRNEKINSAYISKSRLEFQLENSKNNISDIQTELSENKENEKQAEKDFNDCEDKLNNLKKEKEKSEERKEETKNRLDGMMKLSETRKTKLNKIQDDFSKTDISLRETQNKLQLLYDLENSMEGFAYSVKHIMNVYRQGRINGVCGSVAQIISVEPKYSVAVETALGGTLQNIVVENEETAKRGIRILKEDKAGRATFLPVTSVKGNRFELNGLSDENGYVAMGCDLVECDEKYRGIVNSLLGRVCIAENIDFAGNIAKKYGYRFRVVTLDGQVVNAGGSFTGGSVQKSTGILSRKNEIESLEKKKALLEQQHNELSVAFKKTKSETERFDAESEGLKEQLNNAENECIRTELEIRSVSELYLQLEQKISETRQSGEKLKQQLIDEKKNIDDVTAELIKTEEEIKYGEKELSDSRSMLEDLRTERENSGTELSELRVQLAEIIKDTQACELSVEQLVSSIENSNTDSSKLVQVINDCRQQIEEKKKKSEEIKTRIAQSSYVKEDIRKRIESAQRQHIEFDNHATMLRNRTKSKTDEKEHLSDQITRTEERKASLETEFDKLVGQLWDEYGLTRSEAVEIAEIPEDVREATAHLSELKSKIKNLGNVNLGAIEEYAEVSEKYEFLSGQLEDVTTSKIELEKMIDELTENMKSMFVQAFERINNNFRKIFAELFGGGKGELILTDPENVLECGIEINVQPPGKVITNLMSLSGGEQALVAIAIYFSILKISPSPFCLLDEIEAALDDVNVTRYAQYLHRLTDKTQFITITHRRGTMEEADVLYGVTMQEKGISKLLKMSAEETRNMKLDN